MLFTASSKPYVDKIIKIIDPKSQFFSHIFHKENCTKVKKALIKDLRIFKDRNLEDMLIVDNNIYSYALQLGNGIPILSFFGKSFYDNELQELEMFIDKVFGLDGGERSGFLRRYFMYDLLEKPVLDINKLTGCMRKRFLEFEKVNCGR